MIMASSNHSSPYEKGFLIDCSLNRTKFQIIRRIHDIRLVEKALDSCDGTIRSFTHKRDSVVHII